MRNLALVFIIFILNSIVYGQTATAPSSGSGTLENPWQIASLANLYWILVGEDVVPSPPLTERLSANYIQIADIDASETSNWHLDPWGMTTGWCIGGTFNGIYNGKGYVISRLYYDYIDGSNAGLFPKVDNATIVNVVLSDVDFNCDDYSGALIGTCYNSTIMNCSVTGNITASFATGPNSLYFGGLIGSCYNAVVENCYSSASVKGGDFIGGLIGEISNNSYVKNCYSTGKLEYLGNYFGGLIGNCSTSVTLNSFWDIQTSGVTVSSGGEGKTTTEMKTLSTFTDAGWDFEHVWGIAADYPFLRYGIYLDITTELVSIASDSVMVEGLITSLGDSTVTQHGHCWGFTIDPSVDNNKTELGSIDSTGVYFSALTGLEIDTKYFVRAYAINSEDTIYGNNISFVTPETTAVHPSGSGSEGSPYEIASFDNLYWLSLNSNYWDKFYIQTEEIDASFSSEMNDGDGWNPIGNSLVVFSGSYNGQGHTIDNLTIRRESPLQGFFGYINGATVKRLGVRNVSFLCGYFNESYSTSIGGIAGCSMNSTFEECYSTGKVEGYITAGGMIGDARNSNIMNCYSTVVGGYGGLIGDGYGSVLTNCYSTGYVSGSYHAGGLVGYGGTANNSFWDIETSGKTVSACGIGKTTTEMKSDTTFINSGWDFTDKWNIDPSYNMGYPYLRNQYFPPTPIVVISGVSEIGTNTSLCHAEVTSIGNSEITQHGVCWNTIGLPAISDNFTELGTLIVSDRFDSEVTGININTFYYVRAYAINSEGITYSNEITFNTLPILAETPAGSGTATIPYQIENLANLYWISENPASWSKYFIQTANIDASETTTWFPDRTGICKGWDNNLASLTVGYNGQYFTIDNLYIYRPQTDYIGLFKSAKIENLGLTNIDITGEDWIGGFGAYATLKNCYATGIVTGNNTVGGLCAYNIYDFIEGCYSNIEVTGNRSVGGLVGSSIGMSETHNSYSKGSVTGGDTVGGLVGFLGNDDSFPVISKCYSTSIVNGISNTGGLIGDHDISYFVSSSYWDIEVSGQATSAGGTGRTTAEMQNQSFYTGWDFIGESTNGTEDIWNIDPHNNEGYPYLTWENYTGIEADDHIPVNTILFQNYPNPFNPETTIRYSLVKDAQVKLTVFDITGREVAGLVDQKQDKGYHEAKFNGDMLTSGMYFYRLSVNDKVVASRKMMMIK